MRSRARTLTLAAASIGAVLAAAGCGTGGYFGTGNQANGKAKFNASCAGCHTLAADGSSGKMGPNLDLAFGYIKQQGFKAETIRQIVATQIKQAQGAMPANLLAGKDVTDVADYVATVAGNPRVTPTDPTGYGYLATTSAPSAPAMQTDSGAKPTEAVLAQGKKIFVNSGCSACHTLAAAGASWKIGPNLDKLNPEKQTIRAMVNAGGGAMPAFKGQLSPSEIDAVAAYVAENAGDGAPAKAEGSPAPAKPAPAAGGTAAAGDPVAGKKVFTTIGCAACHTLKDAGSSGTIGPNLDQRKPTAAKIRDRVTNGKGAMPAFGKSGQLTAKQIDDVVAYVSSVAGK